VFGALNSLVKATGLAALIATHNMDLAQRMDRRVTLRDGMVVELAESASRGEIRILAKILKPFGQLADAGSQFDVLQLKFIETGIKIGSVRDGWCMRQLRIRKDELDADRVGIAPSHAAR